jgi:hypothetical protein
MLKLKSQEKKGEKKNDARKMDYCGFITHPILCNVFVDARLCRQGLGDSNIIQKE